MWEPVRPLGGRALLSRTRGQHAFRRLVVDRVDTEDRTYEVLHLGTGEELSFLSLGAMFRCWPTGGRGFR